MRLVLFFLSAVCRCITIADDTEVRKDRGCHVGGPTQHSDCRPLRGRGGRFADRQPQHQSPLHRVLVFCRRRRRFLRTVARHVVADVSRTKRAVAAATRRRSRRHVSRDWRVGRTRWRHRRSPHVGCRHAYVTVNHRTEYIENRQKTCKKELSDGRREGMHGARSPLRASIIFRRAERRQEIGIRDMQRQCLHRVQIRRDKQLRPVCGQLERKSTAVSLPASLFGQKRTSPQYVDGKIYNIINKAHSSWIILLCRRSQ